MKAPEAKKAYTAMPREKNEAHLRNGIKRFGGLHTIMALNTGFDGW